MGDIKSTILCFFLSDIDFFFKCIYLEIQHFPNINTHLSSNAKLKWLFRFCYKYGKISLFFQYETTSYSCNQVTNRFDQRESKNTNVSEVVRFFGILQWGDVFEKFWVLTLVCWYRSSILVTLHGLIWPDLASVTVYARGNQHRTPCGLPGAHGVCSRNQTSQ